MIGRRAWVADPLTRGPRTPQHESSPRTFGAGAGHLARLRVAAVGAELA